MWALILIVALIGSAFSSDSRYCLQQVSIQVSTVCTRDLSICPVGQCYVNMTLYAQCNSPDPQYLLKQTDDCQTWFPRLLVNSTTFPPDGLVGFGFVTAPICVTPFRWHAFAFCKYDVHSDILDVDGNFIVDEDSEYPTSTCVKFGLYDYDPHMMGKSIFPIDQDSVQEAATAGCVSSLFDPPRAPLLCSNDAVQTFGNLLVLVLCSLIPIFMF